MSPFFSHSGVLFTVLRVLMALGLVCLHLMADKNPAVTTRHSNSDHIIMTGQITLLFPTTHQPGADQWWVSNHQPVLPGQDS